MRMNLAALEEFNIDQRCEQQIETLPSRTVKM